MQVATNLKNFHCSIHPTEYVQRVCVDSFADNCLGCIECILSGSNESNKHSIIGLEEFINRAINLPQNEQITIQSESSTSNGIINLSSTEEEAIKNFSIILKKKRQK